MLAVRARHRPRRRLPRALQVVESFWFVFARLLPDNTSDRFSFSQIQRARLFCFLRRLTQFRGRRLQRSAIFQRVRCVPSFNHQLYVNILSPRSFSRDCSWWSIKLLQLICLPIALVIFAASCTPPVIVCCFFHLRNVHATGSRAVALHGLDMDSLLVLLVQAALL